MRVNTSNDKAGLIEESVEVLSDMDEPQIRQFITMMKAVNGVV